MIEEATSYFDRLLRSTSNVLVARFQVIRMTEHPPPPGVPNMMLDPQDENLYDLRDGIDRGFLNVMGSLNAIAQQLEGLHLRTAELVSSQTAASATFGDPSHANRFPDDIAARNQELSVRIDSLYVHLQEEKNEVLRLKKLEAESRLELARVKAKEVKFREIIVGKAGVQKVTDQEVIYAFANLRQQVQALSRNSVYKLDIDPRLSSKSTQIMRTFYNRWKGPLNAKDLAMRMRAEIFYMLDDNILSVRCFGLHETDGSKEQLRGYDSVEKHLQRFEEILEDNKVGDDAIAEWRISTLGQIDDLKLPGDYSKQTADQIFNLLAPVLHPKASKKDKDEVYSVITEVCRQAFNLRMMMRKSKEGYRCELPPKEAYFLSRIEPFADSFGVEGGKADDQSDEIAYCLFGALVKDARHLGGEKKVLDKAQVILKRNTREAPKQIIASPHPAHPAHPRFTPYGGKGLRFHAMPISTIESKEQVDYKLVYGRADGMPNSLESMVEHKQKHAAKWVCKQKHQAESKTHGEYKEGSSQTEARKHQAR
ncbi:hypothetical protein V498_08517 [Pseudogymnoascus sp. VKM F-4517 (FW-2822)]|nr:hypothetical protein V498_08517 [Pseudogymnoascus sp. VKM F-4517 (FW-2822)]